MQKLLAVGLVLLISDVCIAQDHRNSEKFPTEVVIGRDSFIDIGPPFNYYDLTFLVADGDETDVERVSLTPPADSCFLPAEIRTVHVVLHETLSSLLQATNPCSIPEKALKTEMKRRNEGLPVFSGMNVSMQVQCADKNRVIRADILDRDIFDEHPRTPQYTAWSQALFETLDQATGNRPWDTPIVAVAGRVSSMRSTSESTNMQAIADGKYDAIFGKASDRPSELYRLAQSVLHQPLIELTKSDPVRPVTYVDPVYPPIAKVAHVHGMIEFHLAVDNDGATENITIDSGPKLLWKAAIDAIAKWKFSTNDTGKSVSGSIRFGLNCAADSK